MKRTQQQLNAICEAIDTVKSYSAQRRKSIEREAQALARQIARADEALSLAPSQEHAAILALGEFESRAESIACCLSDWTSGSAEAMRRLEQVVGLGVRRTVNPEVHALIGQLAAVQRRKPDGTECKLSLADIAVATGLSEGTVSKLKSGTYPASSFPASIKRGRRAAAR